MQMVNHKRIAKNTLLLYLRMALIMLIGLVASRVVLSSLGAVDFGLYNVIGGIVVALSFMSGAMNASCNRYYSIALGKEDQPLLHEVFKANLLIYAIFCLAVLIICETIGLWLLNAKLVIPVERMGAARWVYQFSIVTFVSGLLAIPYKSAITAREKMKVYAYASIIEASLKLLIVFFLDKAPVDKLVFYAFLIMLVSLCTNLFYVLYCKRFYSECHFDKRPEKALCKEIIAFNGWGLIGSFASVLRNQGVNILLNMFYGPVVNAARGVANQVYINVYQFVQNYALAFNPQIVKSYSAGQKKDCNELIFKCSTLSYLLLFAISAPLISEMPIVMNLWLVEVPEHSIAFARIMLLTALVDSLYLPLYYGIQATGKVKWLNVLVGGCQIAVVVAAYILLKIKSVSPEMVFYLILGAALLSQIIRVALSRKYLGISILSYLKKVIVPLVALTIVTSAALYAISALMPSSIVRLAISVLISVICVLICLYLMKIKEKKDERA